MENKNNRIEKSRVNRTVYLTIVTVLVVTALLVGAANIMQRRSKPAPGEDTARGADTAHGADTVQGGESDTSAANPSGDKNGGSKADTDAAKLKTGDATGGETTADGAAPSAKTPSDTSAPGKNNARSSTDTPSSADISEEVPAGADQLTGDAAQVSGGADVAAIPVFTAPVAGVISSPHSDSVLVYSMTLNDYRTHTGVDIEAELGAPVLAAADGAVAAVWSDPMMGDCVSIEHDGGAVSIYKNLMPASASELAEGIRLERGDVIGAVGESAIIETALEPHLHFELEIDGVAVNPADYVDFTASK